MTSFFPWRRVFLPAAFSSLLISPAFAQEPKQIAGPPSDFLGATMRLPDPADLGVRSKAATIPIRLAAQGDSWAWEGQVAVDSGEQLSMMLLSPESHRWEMSMSAPNGPVFARAESLAAAFRDTSYGFGSQHFPGRYFAFAGMQEGAWTVSVRSRTAPTPKEHATADGYLIVSSDSRYKLYSFVDRHDTLLGNEISILAYGIDATNDAESRAPAPEKGLVRSAELTLFLPSGAVTKLEMLDDGSRGDGLEGDGVFGSRISLTELGEWRAQVIARGETPEGKPFLRSAEHSFPVVFPEIELSGLPSRSATVGSHRVTVEIPTARPTGQGIWFKAFAQLWGHSSEGKEIPICWIGGIVSPNGDVLPVGLDLRWVALAKAQAPFSLREVRVMDIDTDVLLSQAEQIDVELPELASSIASSVTGIDEEMLMGPRPASSLPPGSMAATSAGKVLLVHGYCSTDVWGPVQSQFTQYAIFYDLKKNRTHDQFANLIKNFGAQFPSYGIIAHSQGGCASLHLYTYYWSGLDNAVGPRLIQSVGTPYQGTALAGNLAVLGQVFGVGCGTNANLTYSGAAAWLAGIPTWARSKVNFYTTSFTDQPYVYDYCSLATDLLLSDPEDGVTEKTKGFLSGGINRGHKTGWCHSSGMRDPAQTTDASRNSVMNLNAAH